MILLCAGLLFLLLPNISRAQQASPNTIRIWGDSDMTAVLGALEHRFSEFHPQARFENQFLGTDSAMPALYAGLADIALLGREPNQTEHDGFLHSLQYEPQQFHLIVGALDSEGHSYAPVIFVGRDNPLKGLTLAQLAATLGCGQTHGAQPVRTWGDLGLTGRWAARPVHVYAFDTESGTGAFLVRRLQGASRKMNWPIIREFHDLTRSDGSSYPAGQQTVDALLSDPDGIAVSGLRYAKPDVKLIPIAAEAGSAYIFPTAESLIEGAYPFTRMTYAFANKPPDQSLRPLLRDFLRFLYGEDARLIISSQGGFLPLSRSDAARQVEALPQ